MIDLPSQVSELPMTYAAKPPFQSRILSAYVFVAYPFSGTLTVRSALLVAVRPRNVEALIAAFRRHYLEAIFSGTAVGSIFLDNQASRARPKTSRQCPEAMGDVLIGQVVL